MVARDSVSTALIAAVAIAVGVMTAWNPLVGAILSVLLVGGLAASLLLARSRDRPAEQVRWRWVSVAWLLVLLVPMHHFYANRSALAAAEGSLSLENVAELLVHAGAAAAALVSLRTNGFSWRPPWPLLGIPVLALLSTAWSTLPGLTFGRSFELLAIIALTMLTAAIVRSDRDEGRALVRETILLLVLTTGALCVIGLTIGDLGLSGQSTDAPLRFTWPGAHPVVSAAIIGAAWLSVVFGGREATRLPLLPRLALVVLFSACLYLGETRTTLIALAGATLVALWFGSKRRPVRRVVGALIVVGAVYLLVQLVGASVSTYLARGQDPQQIASFNGRTGLWAAALDQLDSPQRWLFGYGLGSVRALLLPTFSWAGGAHNAWIELLVGLGLFGLAAGLVAVLTTATYLWRGEGVVPIAGALPVTLFVYLLLMSPTADAFAAPGPGPGLGFGLMAFLFALAARPRGEEARRREEAASRPMPAPEPAGARLAPV